jgi:hypothetical protein
MEATKPPQIRSREEAKQVLEKLARAELVQGYSKTSWEEEARCQAVSFLQAEHERKTAIAEAAERRFLMNTSSTNPSTHASSWGRGSRG